MKKIIFIGIFLAVLLAAFFISNQGPGEYDDFASCVAESGAVMYSAWWCPHCQDQKRDFGKSFEIIDEAGAHVECSPGGTRTFSEFCREQGITGTPTWRFPDGTEISGRVPLPTIAEKTGCSL